MLFKIFFLLKLALLQICSLILSKTEFRVLLKLILFFQKKVHNKLLTTFFVIKKRALILFKLPKLKQCFVFFIKYIYLFIVVTNTNTQSTQNIVMQTNKQNKIVWQQLQITATELAKIFSKFICLFF